MGIDLATRKMLWANSGNKCSFPNCNEELVFLEGESVNPSNIGEEAHIVGKNEDGPRGLSLMDSVQRDNYDNLILLCRNHHKIVDDQVSIYSVEVLKEYKYKHENWVKENLTFDSKRIENEILIARYIDKLFELAEIENWYNWTSGIFAAGPPSPSINQRIIRKLEELDHYSKSRIWPDSHQEIKKAFNNFIFIAYDFIGVFKKFAVFPIINKNEMTQETIDNQIIHTSAFYKLEPHTEEEYNRLANKWEYHCDLVIDLGLEMTRAANYILDLVRLHIFSDFRMDEGKLLVQMAPNYNFRGISYCPEYKAEEKKTLYTDLKSFMEIRDSRNRSMGTGISNFYL